MSKEDWELNPVHCILKNAGLWPFEDGEIKTVLDVACGLALKSKYLSPDLIVGVDMHVPYLNAIVSKVPYAVVQYDVRKLRDIFIEDSFDVVYAIDILEHLECPDAYSMIDQCKEIARKAVVVETPNGFIPQNLDIQGFGAHKYQTHRSGWTVKDLRAVGFECVCRNYKMQEVQRHTEIQVDPDIELIDGIYIKER